MRAPRIFNSTAGAKIQWQGRTKSALSASACAGMVICAWLALTGLPEALAQAPAINSEPFQRAKAIQIQEFTVEQSTLLSTVNALNRAVATNDPLGNGVYILLQDAARLTTEGKITLSFKNISLAEAAEKLSAAANLKLEAKGRFLSLNTVQPIEVEYLRFTNDFAKMIQDVNQLQNDGWQCFSSTQEEAWIGGANKPARVITVYCRKKPVVQLRPPSF